MSSHEAPQDPNPDLDKEIKDLQADVNELNTLLPTMIPDGDNPYSTQSFSELLGTYMSVAQITSRRMETLTGIRRSRIEKILTNKRNATPEEAEMITAVISIEQAKPDHIEKAIKKHQSDLALKARRAKFADQGTRTLTSKSSSVKIQAQSTYGRFRTPSHFILDSLVTENLVVDTTGEEIETVATEALESAVKTYMNNPDYDPNTILIPPPFGDMLRKSFAEYPSVGSAYTPLLLQTLSTDLGLEENKDQADDTVTPKDEEPFTKE